MAKNPHGNSKNFAWLMWGGSLFLIVGPLGGANVDQQLLIIFTAVIPLLFWAMDYQWRRHLRYAGERQKIISRSINSEHFLKAMEYEGKSGFPVLDPVGWIYTKQSDDEEVISLTRDLDPLYLMDRRMFGFLQIAFYKEAGIYFSTMILISIAFGILYGL